MVYSEKIKTSVRDIEMGGRIGNRAILEYLENAASRHADSLGYGINAIREPHVGWVLVDWKVRVLKRMTYGQELTVRTWSRSIVRYLGLRDFEILDESGEVCVTASSKWLLIDTEKKSVMKADDALQERFGSEPERCVFPGDKLEKPAVPEALFGDSCLCRQYTALRRDMDFMGHLHNTYYLDIAHELLPGEVYEKRLFDNTRIVYSKEIKLGDTVNCKYACDGGRHIILLQSTDGETNHALIELY